MNLSKLFNKNYAIQNVKKSKGILAIMLIIIPVITMFIMYNMRIDGDSSYSGAFDISVVAIPNIIGMFIIPFILSNVLLGYVYKQNSVDFINSMPISRKTIFLTNIIVGSLYILFLQLVNLLLEGMFILISSTTVVFPIIVDVFATMTIGYLFIFAISCLALTVSGNKFTQIVVALLILFIIPFSRIINLMDFNYGGVNIISANGSINTYDRYYYSEGVYTVPINIFILLMEEQKIYDLKANVFTGIIFLIYVFAGMKLFEKRKMENSGVSFNSDKIHLLVKALTIYPMVYFVKMIFFRGNFNTDYIPQLLFAIALILIYYLIYDLITSKKIKLRVNLLSYIVSFAVLFVIVTGINEIYKKSYEDINIEVNNIKNVSVNLEDKFFISEDEEKLLISNRDIVNFLFDKSFGIDEIYNGKIEGGTDRISGIVELRNGKKVKIGAYFKNNDYKEFVNKLLNDKQYVNEIKEIYGISKYSYYSNEYSYGSYIDLNKNPELKILLNDNMENLIKQKLQKIAIGDYNNTELINLVMYKNHKKYDLRLELYESEYLNSIINVQNKINSEKLKRILTGEEKRNAYYGDYDYYEYNLIRNKKGFLEYSDRNIQESKNGKITEFIINNSETFDFSKPYYKLYSYRDGIAYFTNNIEKIEQVIKEYIDLDKEFYNNNEARYYDDVVYEETTVKSRDNDQLEENTSIENIVEDDIQVENN